MDYNVVPPKVYEICNAFQPFSGAYETSLIVVFDYPSLSDHKYIMFNLLYSPSKHIPIADSSFNFNKINWSGFSAILLDSVDNIYAMSLLSQPEIDQAMKCMTKLIIKAMS